MTPPELVTPPASLPLTVAKVRGQARVFSSAEDSLIEDYIAAATGMLDGPDGILGRCLITQTWRLFFGCWKTFDLVFPDVSAAVVTYVDTDGAPQTLAGDMHYIERGFPSRLVPAPGFSAIPLGTDVAWPIQIEVTAGFGDAEAVPARIRQAIRMLAAYWYDQRGAASPDPLHNVPYAVETLISTYRRIWV